MASTINVIQANYMYKIAVHVRQVYTSRGKRYSICRPLDKLFLCRWLYR